MAVYDRDATASTAVAAFLAQFKIASTGAITYVSGSNTFHVWWLHRALQKIAWDFAISGDDEINFSAPNPSTSEALGTIITLLDHTTDYSVSYSITDEVAEYLFGGSIEQGGASVTRYSGLVVLGSVASTTTLQIVQNGALVTEYWGTGLNQTDSSTLLRILIKTIDAGSEVDNHIVNVKSNTWGDTFAIWQTTLGLGEKVAAINTFSDPNNDTAQLTVEGYSITPSYGYKLIDVDGNGDKAFIGEWSYGAYNKKALHEFVKSILVYGTSETIYGIDGDIWTGRLIDCSIGSGANTWAQDETLSWGSGATAGTGTLVAVDNTAGASTARLILHLATGVAPEDAMTITGAGSATGVTDATPVGITTNPNLLGVFTGAAWIGAYGMGFVEGELTSADSVTDLDGNLLSPPNNVPIAVNVTCGDTGDAPHVFLAEKNSGLNAPDYNTYDGETGTASDAYLDVDAPIASDVPGSGYVGVKHSGNTSFTFYKYSSWNNDDNTPNGRFILDSVTLDDDVVAGDDVFVAMFYELAAGGGLVKTASTSLIYTSEIDVIGWVRHGDPAIPDKPVAISGTIGAAGLSIAVQLDDES